MGATVVDGVRLRRTAGPHRRVGPGRAGRINRIFEGTNEINRLLATGMLLKRAQRGQLPLVEAVKKLQAEVLGGPTLSAGGDERPAPLRRPVSRLGKVFAPAGRWPAATPDCRSPLVVVDVDRPSAA